MKAAWKSVSGRYILTGGGRRQRWCESSGKGEGFLGGGGGCVCQDANNLISALCRRSSLERSLNQECDGFSKNQNGSAVIVFQSG